MLKRIWTAPLYWLGLLPKSELLPRKYCSFTTIPLTGVPKKHAKQAILIRLQQLGIYENYGFAFKKVENLAHVWYWDAKQAKQYFGAKHIQPWPETLWYDTLTQGARFSNCREGFEIEGISAQGNYRSRWFSTTPSSEDKDIFLRDLGLKSEQITKLSRQELKYPNPSGDWDCYSASPDSMSLIIIASALFLTLSGAILIKDTIELMGIQHATGELKTKNIEKKKQIAKINTLETQLRDLAPTIDAIRSNLKPVTQTQILHTLSANHLVGSSSNIYILDWSFFASSITVNLKLPATVKPASFVGALESTQLFSEVSLMPDPAPGTLRVQLKLNSEAI